MADSDKRNERAYGHVIALELIVSALAQLLPAPAKENFSQFLSAYLKYADGSIESTMFKGEPEMRESFASCIKRLQKDIEDTAANEGKDE